MARSASVPKPPLWRRILPSILILVFLYFVLPAAMMWGMLHWTLDPDERAKLKIAPERLLFDEGASHAVPHSIGYASFRLPREARLTRRLPAFVNVETGELLLGLLPPEKAEDAREAFAQRERMAFDWWWGWLGRPADLKVGPPRNMVDVYQSEIDVAPRPTWQQFLKGPGESLALTMSLLVKSLILQPDVERVLYFSSPRTFGVILLVEGGTRGRIHLSTQDRAIEQLMLFRLASPPTELPGRELSAFLSTYTLTIDHAKSEEEIGAMIAAEGIVEDPDANRWRSN